MFRVLAITCALAAASGGQRAVPSRDSAARLPAGVISGRVVVWNSPDSPVRRALVRLANASGSQTLSVTDEHGRFAFRELEPGSYSATVSKAAFVTSFYGSRLPWRGPSTPIVVSNKGPGLDLIMPIVPGAVVTGKVQDIAGRPIESAQVYAIGLSGSVAGPAPRPSGIATAPSNDLGEYRLFGLAPGTYVVAARWPDTARSAVRPTTDAEAVWAQRQDEAGRGAPAGDVSTLLPDSGAQLVSVPAFHPGVADVTRARPVTLDAGGSHAGVDIVLQRVPPSGLTGSVSRPDGSAGVGATISVLRGGLDALMGMLVTTLKPDAHGNFRASSLAPGVYTVVAQESPVMGSSPARSAASQLWATEEVHAIAGSSSNLHLRLRAAPTVSGKVVFDGPNPPDAARVRITLTFQPQDGRPAPSMPAAHPSADGTFTVAGGPPGKYVLSATPVTTAGARWALQSATGNGVNLLDPFDVRPGDHLSGVVVTVTDRVTELTVDVLSDRDQAALQGMSVFVVGVERRYWTYPSRRAQVSRLSTNARARFFDLPAGEYSVTLLADSGQVDLTDPQTIEALVSTGARVSVAEGKTTMLKVAIGR